MIYEYRVYETMTGKLPNLNARFRDHTLKFFEKHGIKSIGYWTPEIGGQNNTLIYLIAYDDMGHREKAWKAFSSDPEWHKVVAESEANGLIVKRVSNSFLTPTDYSPLK